MALSAALALSWSSRFSVSRLRADKLKLELQRARLHRHADLEIPRVIPRAGQRRDLALGQFGREPLLAEVGKTHRGHRAAQLDRATRRIGWRRKPLKRNLSYAKKTVDIPGTRHKIGTVL